MTGRAALAVCALALSAGVAASAPKEETEHVVQVGESLNDIASRAKVSRETIIKANGLEPPYIVEPGVTLKIPRRTRTARSDRNIPTVSFLARASTHQVREGETLAGVAMRARVPRNMIAAANGITSASVIQAGDMLIIPRSRTYKVHETDSVHEIAQDIGIPWHLVAQSNEIAHDAPIKAEQSIQLPTDVHPPVVVATPAQVADRLVASFAWPVTGAVRRGFSSRTQGDFHDGLDIIAPHGSPVVATEAGTVVYAGKGSGARFKTLGMHVIVDHGHGLQSTYAFPNEVTVRPGYRIARGERIGHVGNTGLGQGDELHFELRRDGRPVNPETLMQDRT